MFLRNKGYCICCDRETIFRSEDAWLRDHYLCQKCGSLPRERALMKTVDSFYPQWRKMSIHESSPVERGASQKLKRECKHYVASQFWPDRPTGVQYNGVYNINLEQQSFEDNLFDLVVTQDVFEHIYEPRKALSEIGRTLKKGGAHICTIPLVNKDKPTQRWSELINGEINWLYTPEYHGNPVNPQGAPVSYHYGYDICELVQEWSEGKMRCMMVYMDAIDQGIRAEFIEVLIMRKLSH